MRTDKQGCIKSLGKALLLIMAMVALPCFSTEQYMTVEQFVEEAFGAEKPKSEVLWVSKTIATQATKILGHSPSQLRQHYWKSGNKTAWVLEEIGKEEPITAGFVVVNGKMSQVKILTYRESRGWEIRYPAFLKQYQSTALSADYTLTHSIDGISGATLSVSAMNRMARLALYFDRMSHLEN